MTPGATSAPPPGAPPKGKNPFQDPEAMAAMGLERTKNKTGFMYLRIGESATHWLNSLPHSSSPLLDLGAAYGVHTLHAMKAGRDVIAVDMEQAHIDDLRVRADDYAKSSAAENSTGPGKLVRATVATLPDPSVCADESVAGVLLSEVIHFMRPGQPQVVFSDIFRWLKPGGRLVVTTAASKGPKVEEFANKAGFKLNGERSVEEAIDMISTASGPELVKAAPTFMELPQDSPMRKFVCGILYLMSTKEVETMAKEAGFKVERCRYITTGKYPDKTIKGETVLLVAKKPDPAKRDRNIRTAAAVAVAAASSLAVYHLAR